MTNAIKKTGATLFFHLSLLAMRRYPKCNNANLCLQRRKQDCYICRALRFVLYHY